MLQPKRTKFRKQHKGRIHGEAKGGSDLNFGSFGLKAAEPERITARQIEAARIAMTRHIRRGGKVWIRIFPDKSYTKKPLEQRMGKGKAPVEGWVAVIKPGRIMFEMSGPAEDVAKEAMRLAIMKMPIRCKFVTKADFKEGAPLESGLDHSLAIVKRKNEIAARHSAAAESAAASAPAVDQAPAATDAGEENA